MKGILALIAVVGGFASLWFAAYWTMTVDEPSKKKCQAVGLTIGLIGAVLLAWLVEPTEGATEMGWGWVLLALLITICLASIALATPGSVNDVLAKNATDSAAMPQTRAIRTGWSRGEIAFTYEDFDGVITYRTVTVHSVSGTYIKGECHTRVAERTFRVDRIVGDITDCETGEILSAQKWARQNQN